MRWPWPPLASFRLRLLFRSAFLLLLVATVAMTLSVLQEEKNLSYQNYRDSFKKTEAQIIAKLHHPTGQLALLNPPTQRNSITPLRPMVLPFSSLDFDDQTKVQQAVEMAGCLVQYADAGSICVAVGNNPWAGGFIYVAGSFTGEDLVPRPRGERDFTVAHRLRVQVALRGETYRWIAPFEVAADPSLASLSGPPVPVAQQGRLTGFLDNASNPATARPVRDFRGWIWQGSQCIGSQSEQPGATPDCIKRSFFSVRLPVDIYRDALFKKTRPVWPPEDLDRTEVRVEILAPGNGPALLDSNSEAATAPFSLTGLQDLLLPGETLKIRKLADAQSPPLVSLRGDDTEPPQAYPGLSTLLSNLIRKLPGIAAESPLESRQTITTPLGSYELWLNGDARSVSKSLGVVAARMAWYVAAMLAAILTAWIVIEISIVRRIGVLTRRADSVAKSVHGMKRLDNFNLNDLRSSDELGILAGCLSDLLARVEEDVRREQIRTAQEKDMWHAVGHEIMSPLQSLMAIHGSTDSSSNRYIYRMQQAVRVLYGSASPSEAFASTNLQMAMVDIHQFLQHVARNAPAEGIEAVQLAGHAGPLWVRADEYSLEDVVTHLLRNAQRYRTAGTPIILTLLAEDSTAVVVLHNQGPAIAADLLDKIFEYGVSDTNRPADEASRGQGLFVARTYMAKMGGTVVARNTGNGVEFLLTLLRAPPGAVASVP